MSARQLVSSLLSDFLDLDLAHAEHVRSMLGKLAFKVQGANLDPYLLLALMSHCGGSW